ncbi:MAG: class II aldolase/adducin family protein [Exilispira sp.]
MIELSNDLYEIVNKKKEELISICKQIVQKNLVTGTWGNVSFKINENYIIITPSGIGYDRLSNENIPIVNTETSEYIGNKPSLELNLHLEIYKRRKDLKAIIHTHSLYASIFAVTGKSLPPILEEIAQICGPKILCTKYAVAGSEELAKNTIKVLKNSNAAFLANHGAIACGRTLKEALTCAITLEKGCEIFYKAKQIGRINFLSIKEAEKLNRFFKENYQSKPD